MLKVLNKVVLIFAWNLEIPNLKNFVKKLILVVLIIKILLIVLNVKIMKLILYLRLQKPIELLVIMLYKDVLIMTLKLYYQYLLWIVKYVKIIIKII